MLGGEFIFRWRQLPKNSLWPLSCGRKIFLLFPEGSGIACRPETIPWVKEDWVCLLNCFQHRGNWSVINPCCSQAAPPLRMAIASRSFHFWQAISPAVTESPVPVYQKDCSVVQKKPCGNISSCPEWSSYLPCFSVFKCIFLCLAFKFW